MGERAGTRARLHRLATATLIAVSVGAVTAGTVAARTPPRTVTLQDRQVWLASPGTLFLVDGTTAEAVLALPLGAAQAADVHQVGVDAVALTERNQVLVAHYADQRVSPSVRFDAAEPASLVAGGDRLYVVPTGGTIDRVVPATSGTRPVAPRPRRASIAADSAGRLWVLDRSDQRLSWYDESRTGTLGKVQGTLVPGPDVVLADPARRRLSIPARPGTSCTVDGDLGRATLSAGDRPGTVLASSPAAGTVQVLSIPGRDGRCGSSTLRLTAGVAWGQPLLTGGRLYLPDHGRGRLAVLDPGSGRLLAEPRVADVGAPVTLVQRAGLVYYNDPRSETAGVVHPDGRIDPIRKTSALAYGPTPRPTAAVEPTAGPPQGAVPLPTTGPSIAHPGPPSAHPAPPRPQKPGRPHPTTRPTPPRRTATTTTTRPPRTQTTTSSVSTSVTTTAGATPSGPTTGPETTAPTTSGPVSTGTSGPETSGPATTGPTTSDPTTGPTTSGPETSGPSPSGSPVPDLLLSISAHGGRVTSDLQGSEKIDCPGRCEARFAPGTRVVLTATTTSEGTAMITGGGCPGTDTCTLTLDADTSLSAVVLGPPGQLGGPDGVAMLQPADDDGSLRRGLDVAWVDSRGRLLYGHPDSSVYGHPELSRPEWTVLSGPGEFTGRPELLDGPGTSLAMLAQGTDGRVWASSNPAAPNGSWTPWVPVADDVTLLHRTLPKLSPDRCPVVVGLDRQGGLWRIAPSFLGDPARTRRIVDDSDRRPVWASTAVTFDGRLHVAAVFGDNGVRVGTLRCDEEAISWSDLGGQATPEPPTLLVRPDNRLQVFVRADGFVWEREEERGGGWTAGDWAPTGSLTPPGRPGVLVDWLGRAIVIGPNPDGPSLQHVLQDPSRGWSRVWSWWDYRRYGATDVYAYSEPRAEIIGIGIAFLTMSRQYPTEDIGEDLIGGQVKWSSWSCEEPVPDQWGNCFWSVQSPAWAAPPLDTAPALRRGP